MAKTGPESDGDAAGEMPRIVRTENVLGGDPRIEGHRIGVHHVYQRYVDGGETPEEIATGYDVSVSEIHAALAYAFTNPEEMREIERRNRRLAEEHGSNRLTPGEEA